MAEIYDPQDLDNVFESLANKHRQEETLENYVQYFGR